VAPHHPALGIHTCNKRLATAAERIADAISRVAIFLKSKLNDFGKETSTVRVKAMQSLLRSRDMS
jgi:hypothetical protein